MSLQGIAGAICFQPAVEAHYEWKVENFFSLSGGDDDYYNSPLEQFSGCTFNFWVHPKKYGDSIVLYLMLNSQVPLAIRYTLGIKTAAGDIEVKAGGTRQFWKPYTYVYCNCMKRSELLNRTQELLPGGALTFTANFKIDDSRSDTGTTEQTSVEDAGGQEANGGRQTLENPAVFTHNSTIDDLRMEIIQLRQEVECLSRTSSHNIGRRGFPQEQSTSQSSLRKQLPETTEVAVQTSVEDVEGQEPSGGRQALENTGTSDVAVQTCLEAIIDQDGNGGHETLERTDFATFCQNIEELKGKDSDVTLEVRGMKFRVHKFILDARAPELAATFFDSASRAKTAVVCVEDCHPEAFEVFLRFVYSGVVENLTSENVTDVYYVANKYDLPRLKKECVQYMLSNLTTGSVCSVIDMAHRHGEELLQERASDFLVENAREVVQTAFYRKFIEENSLAYDLISRVHKNWK